MSSKYSTMIICRELFIWDVIDNLKQTINRILRKPLDLFQWGFKAFLILDCPHRDREKHEATIISSGTTNGFSNPYSPLVSEPHCSTDVAYPHVKKGIKRLVAPNGQQPTRMESQPNLSFVRRVSELEEMSKKLSSQPRRHQVCSETNSTDTCPGLV